MRVADVQLNKRFIIYRCDAGDENYKAGDVVVVDTKEGPQIGKIISDVLRMNAETFPKPTYKILRKVTFVDKEKEKEEEKRAAEALKIGKQKVETLNLPMKLLDVSFASGGGKITFFFTAESRINFRELVKQLAAEFHTRIELRQIGARNEAKLMGGVGCCGRPICCASFLSNFEPVTIRMAKDQALSLDPAKISGLCGRLLCCLAYESDTYNGLKKELPKNGSRVMTAYGEGKVIKVNVISRTLLIELADSRRITIKADELKKKAV